MVSFAYDKCLDSRRSKHFFPEVLYNSQVWYQTMLCLSHLVVIQCLGRSAVPKLWFANFAFSDPCLPGRISRSKSVHKWTGRDNQVFLLLIKGSQRCGFKSKLICIQLASCRQSQSMTVSSTGSLLQTTYGAYWEQWRPTVQWLIPVKAWACSDSSSFWN